MILLVVISVMGLDQWVFKLTNGDITHDDNSVLYWRKCNQIHNWFDNLCGGVENTGDYPICLKDLKLLRDTCQLVMDDHSLASEVLPHMRGSFFGSYDYDDCYYKELKDTVEMIDEVLVMEYGVDENENLYYYHAWW